MTPQELIARMRAWYTAGAASLNRTEPGYEAIGRDTLPGWIDALADVDSKTVGNNGYTLKDWYLTALDVATSIQDYVTAPPDIFDAINEGTGVISQGTLSNKRKIVVGDDLTTGRLGVGTGLGIAALLLGLYVVTR